MSRQEFISTIEYEAIKAILAKALKTNPEELNITTYKSGDFKLDFRNSFGTFGIISSNALRLVIRMVSILITLKL